MVEEWMETCASTDQEVAKAKDQFRLSLARADKLARDLQNPDPARQAQIANTPPHLVGRR
jgi:hypothetical protein